MIKLNKKEKSSRKMDKTMTGAFESILTKHPPGQISPQLKDSQRSLPYIALIAKVILSSPFQKLNLASIYRGLEEKFPHLRSRGPGWRNSVRHNLSVNDCFVKVSRCEDGRGHYWGVHQAHLRDFQQGNFRRYRRTRGRREKEWFSRLTGCLAWMETSFFLGRICEGGSESLGWVEPQCPLQGPRRNRRSPLDQAEAQYHPWRVSVGWADSSCWVRRYLSPQKLQDSYGRAMDGSGHGGQPLTMGLYHWQMHDPIPKCMRESYNSRFMTPLPGFPRCCCMSPTIPAFLINFTSKLS